MACIKCGSDDGFIVEARYWTPYKPRRLSLTFVQATGFVGEARDIGHLEAHVCAGCGLTEWYARDATEELAELAKQPGSGVRRVVGKRPPPYR